MLLSVAVEPIEGFQGSPYPEVDRFVLSLVNKPDTEGGKARLSPVSVWFQRFSMQLQLSWTHVAGLSSTDSCTASNSSLNSASLHFRNSALELLFPRRIAGL